MIVLEIFILLTYMLGCYMAYDTLKSNRVLTVMDITMLILSPFSVVNFAVVKIVSHFFDLDKVVITYENDMD